MQHPGSSYSLSSDPWQFLNAMLEDIEKAQKYVYIEIYKFDHGSIGERFRNSLAKKAGEGIDVRLLIDSWGSYVSGAFFRELTEAGGEVRFFKKIKFFLDFFTKNHRRNHRKLLIIDDRIGYIGSANITGYSMNWRESMLRVEGRLARAFKKVFLDDYQNYSNYVFNQPVHYSSIRSGEFEILRDVPSITKQRIKNRYEWLFKRSTSSVYIESPYFLPGYMLRKIMANASKRGVNVNVIFPLRSDIGLVDVIRNRYLGSLHKSGVSIWYYIPGNLHSKLVLVDEKIFCIGSSNFDYRSFRYQHEIMLQGTRKEIIRQVKEHIHETLSYCEPFDYEDWRKRPFIQRLIEWIFLPFRHLF